jgi:predicted O-methyltransferase YrrM
MTLIDKLLIEIHIDPDLPKLHSTLQSLSKQIKINSYLEVGVWDGGSLISVLKNQKEPLELVTAIDNFNDIYGDLIYENFDHVEKKLNEINYPGRIELIQESSHNVLPRLIEEGRKYDLILVDGDHSYLGQYYDIADCWQLLDVGGIMIIDDTENKDMSWVKHDFEQFFKIIMKGKAIFCFSVKAYPGHIGILRVKE